MKRYELHFKPLMVDADNAEEAIEWLVGDLDGLQVDTVIEIGGDENECY